MAPSKKTTAGKKKNGAFSDDKAKRTTGPPSPFKRVPEQLSGVTDRLSPKHVYVAHIDKKPSSFKRNIFMVPVLMNVGVVALFYLRMRHIVPWYFQIMLSGLGRANETTFGAHEATWEEIAWEVGRRGSTFLIDFLLFAFVWPWPVEFVAGTTHGNPVRWRLKVGFRSKEIYVRRSRDWSALLTGDIFEDEGSNRILTAYIGKATAPLVLEQKTGYLLMNGDWDLDWEAMVAAHQLVDDGKVDIDTFASLAIVHHQDYGWLCHDTSASGTTATASEDERRRQVFAFRDALVSMGKEKLFYRWVETVQFEATQPGGFGPEKQEAAAAKIRALFEGEGVDFDGLWKDTVGGTPSM
ncbi:hypothetical protein GMORB2_1928 [Geosmithia morbida]|uniref:Uncharacterized protein n=1 Tax=Geosmithia morbida TaxID=1094350 RepID=A0A9P4YR02_9HYPO|nr:uncharacterized protein GMORB2_1928 [Geosmithia morbida]KAF4121521.1 hypothetical protein GMORB2_1928 [Geosmithia morbida]